MKTRLPIAQTTESLLPALHARWVDALLGGRPVPREDNATCAACAMLPDEGAALDGAHYFNPATKCCTFLPDLANFLVGGVLLDEAQDAQGTASVRERIRARAGVTPLGLQQSEAFRLVYGSSPEAFGRAEALRCPHYVPEQGGRCGIWRHRESTCATWFCKHERGATAKRFWNRLQQLLKCVEQAVARHCAIELDIGPEALALLHPLRSAHNTSGRVETSVPDAAHDPDLYALLWGRWTGREEEFYGACARIAADLTWNEALALGGAEARALASVVLHAHAATLEESLPARLAQSSFQILAMGPTVCRVQSYSFLDPLDVPRVLFDVLHHFDGRPTEEAIASASAQAGQPLPPGALRMLLDFRILREAP